MEDLEVFVKDVRDFYKCLDKHSSKVDELLKKSVKPCNSILNQTLILRAVADEDSLAGTGLENLDRFRPLLVSSVANSLESDLNLLLGIRDDVIKCGDDLHGAYNALERSFCRVRDKNLVESPLLNPISPRLEHVADWALDSWRCYHALSLQITSALEALDYYDAESVARLAGAFKEDPDSVRHLSKVRSFELSKFDFVA